MRLNSVRIQPEQQMRCLAWQNPPHKKKKKKESTTWKFLWLIKLGIENKLISQLVNARREPSKLFGAFCIIIQTF